MFRAFPRKVSKNYEFDTRYENFWIYFFNIWEVFFFGKFKVRRKEGRRMANWWICCRFFARLDWPCNFISRGSDEIVMICEQFESTWPRSPEPIPERNFQIIQFIQQHTCNVSNKRLRHVLDIIIVQKIT